MDTAYNGVLATERYVFVDRPVRLGGTLIDTQTGVRRSIAPPAEPGRTCGAPSAIGGNWIVFGCEQFSPMGTPMSSQFELYQIATARWRALPAAVDDPVEAVGADWIEAWNRASPASQPQLAFQNIYDGQTETLPSWKPGGRVVPDLNSPSLAHKLCAPIRVPSEWGSNSEDWPGNVRFLGRYAVVAGTTPDFNQFGYLERCGTRSHRSIGPIGALGLGLASANAHAVVWQAGLGVSDLHGAFLPSLTKFSVDTTDLVNQVVSSYTGQNTYESWLTSKKLYVLVNPYTEQCDPTNPCPPDPSELYVAPAPQPTHQRTAHH
jgi:hypothetical protein